MPAAWSGQTAPPGSEGGRHMLNPQPQSYCRLDAAGPAQLVVVIDTEEEFDWASDFARSNTAVGAMRWMHRVQDIFDAYHIIPVYVIDYPVASHGLCCGGRPEFPTKHYLPLLVWAAAGAVGVAHHHRIYRAVARVGKHHIWASVPGPSRALACDRGTVPAWSA